MNAYLPKYGVYPFGNNGQMLLSTSNKDALLFNAARLNKAKEDREKRLRLINDKKRKLEAKANKTPFNLSRFLVRTTMRLALLAWVFSLCS